MNPVPLRVLIVDDSRIFRGGIEEALAGRNDVRVVGSVWSGEKAIEFARITPPDFVTLDIQMPGIGGIETLKELCAISEAKGHPMGIVLISSQTKQGAAVTIEGLQQGAFDFICKPDGPDPVANASRLREQLNAKVDAYLSRGRNFKPAAPIAPSVSPRRLSRSFQAVVIGSSTGGPKALTEVLPAFALNCPVPIFLVQHMPTGFSEYFVSDLNRRYQFRSVEATEGIEPQRGVVYVARGGAHLTVNKRDGRIVTGVSDAPPENGCRPAADVLFRSASVAYSGQVLTVVLTGMGTDGAKGAAVLKRAGAHVVVQDENTSVVWGMPGSVVATGAADDVLPLRDIGPTIRSYLGIGA